MEPSTFAQALIARTSRWSYTRRYLVATLLVATTALLRFAFDNALHGGGYFLFAFAVGLSAIFLDWAAAVWASLLSALLIDYLFQQPTMTLALSTSDAIGLSLFMFGCLLIIVGGQSVRLLVERLNRTQAAKDTLYREMRHRAANNLHLIGTTIAIEATRAKSEETREVLRGIAARIAAIGQVDQLLGAHGGSDAVDAGEHLRELCRFIATSLVGRRPVTVSCESETIVLPRDATETIGIAINELVTNALKHAFAEGEVGCIRVRLAAEAEGVALTVEDDGRGCDRTAEGGIGWRLVASLIAKHGGTMATESAEPGCRIRIRLPLEQRTSDPAAPLTGANVAALHRPQARTRTG